MVAEGLGEIDLDCPGWLLRGGVHPGCRANIFKTLKCYVTFGGLPPDKMEGKGKEFVDKYKAKYNTMPEGYAVYGYESGLVAIEADQEGRQEEPGGDHRRVPLDQGLRQGGLGKWSLTRTATQP